MIFYIEAYYQDDSQILGNLDGQTVLRCRVYKRTSAYKAIASGMWPDGRMVSPRVHQWRVVTVDGKVLESIFNLCYGKI